MEGVRDQMATKGRLAEGNRPEFAAMARLALGLAKPPGAVDGHLQASLWSSPLWRSRAQLTGH
jgi:hypothetical protein